MTFYEEIIELTKKISDIKKYIENETETKQSFVNPLLKILDYDDTNPMEVKFEYGASYGNKKDSRVDYAIIKEGKPVIFIEAKSATKSLENHDGQLNLYFNTTSDVKIGILTNGLVYKFFTDIEKPNMMDPKPFYEIDFENLTDMDVDFLQMFKKEKFNINEVIGFARTSEYEEAIKDSIKDLLENPSDEFIHLLIKDTGLNLSIEKSKQILEKVFDRALHEIAYEKGFVTQNTCISNIIKDDIPVASLPKKESTPLEIIKQILVGAGKDITGVGCDKNIDYDTIYNKTSRNGWFLKIWDKGSTPFITTKLNIEECVIYAPGFSTVSIHPKHGNAKVLIKNIEDIEEIKDLIVKSFEIVQG